MVAQPSTELDPATQPARRLRFRRPDRLDHAHHERHIDVAHRQSTEHRRGISLERILPLLPVLWIAPTRLVRLQVGIDTGIEGQCPGGLELPLGPLGLAGGDRIDAGVQQFAAFQGAGPRLIDAHHVDRTEPHVAGLAAALVAEQPRLAAAVDLQIQPAAIAVTSIATRAADGQEL